MKLGRKTVIMHLIVSLMVVTSVTIFLRNYLVSSLHSSIRTEVTSQLSQIDFYLSEFFTGLENDLDTILAQPVVRTRKDQTFTSFLKADEKTFVYNYGAEEKEIIRIFNDYRKTHPLISSIYMGRENGTFVRSHPRESPTTYDPRTRPWYLQGLKSPLKISRTPPYSSVTSDDVNIGIIRGMLDESGKIFGVLGMDVTLNKLTTYLSEFQFRLDGTLILIDDQGTILTYPDKKLLFTPIKNLSLELSETMFQDQNIPSTITMDGISMEVIPRKMEKLGWRCGVIIPTTSIEREVQNPLFMVLGSLVAGLAILSFLTIFGQSKLVISPILSFSAMVTQIAQTQNLEKRIYVNTKDEIGDLVSAWNTMMDSLKEAHDKLKTTDKELRTYQNHLEALVAERTETLLIEKNRAEAADRVKSSFLATMSHELRTPLNSIIGFTGIILKGLVGPLNDEQKKQLTMVKGSAHHLLALINDVLDISKIEAGEFTIVSEPFNLEFVIDKAILTAVPLAAKKGLQILKETPGSFPQLKGDARRVEQVLLNLLSNAVKFTEKGQITLKAHEGPTEVRIEVIDTGIGIQKKDLETLFQAFHQIDTGLTRKYEGTGLGLSISKHLVSLMGGTMEVDSCWGQGTTFTFTLPYGSSSS